MTSDDYILAKLVEAAWRAAGHISTPAVLAVMFAFRTRVLAEEEKDWLKNIRAVQVPDIEIDPRNPSFQAALELVDSVYSGERLDNLTNGGIYWRETTEPMYVQYDKIVLQCAQVGTLMFFK